MKKAIFLTLLFFGVIIFSASYYIVGMSEQVVITAFGKQAGKPITEPGLYFKTPFIQDVNRYDKRILEWDGPPIAMATKDKVYINLDTYARWRINDLDRFFVRIRDERSAESRLSDILASTTMSIVGQHELIELIRSTPDRKVNPALSAAEGSQPNVAGSSVAQLQPIKLGRKGVEKMILEAARPALTEYGVELIDIRFKRLNYDNAVAGKINERMISERKQIAERFRSEGAAMAARIMGDRERDLQKIESEAYKAVQKIRGEADAKATEIYAKAFNQSPEAIEFYSFQKTLETYENSMPPGASLVFSTDSELFRYLKGSEKAAVPAVEKKTLPAVEPPPPPAQ
jgi:modulator of FtsH protease HflC